jgi:hypothetical protein
LSEIVWGSVLWLAVTFALVAYEGHRAGRRNACPLGADAWTKPCGPSPR